MRLIILLAIAAMAFSCKSKEAPAVNSELYDLNEYKTLAEKPRIQVQVAGLNGGLAYLIGIVQEQNFKVDSATIDASGNILFEEAEPYHPGMLYVLLPNNANFQVLVDLDQTITMKTNINDLTGAMQVEGSIDNELLYKSFKFENDQMLRFQENSQKTSQVAANSPEAKALKEELNKLLDERKAFLEGLFNQYPNSLFTKFKRAGQNPDIRGMEKADGTLDTVKYMERFKAEFWEGVDFNDARLLYTPVIANKLKRYIKELTPQLPDAVWASSKTLVDKVLDKKDYFMYFANWIALEYEPKQSKMMDSEMVFVNMIQNYFTYDKAFWSDSVEIHGLQLRAHEMAASLLGKKGQDVVSTDPSGRTRSLYEIKDPYIVIYMYNPECEHCQEQTPKLVNFYREWKPKGVEVFAIAVDTDDAKWRAYISKMGMPWINVYDPTNKSIYAKYFVDITPEIYVLNKDRILIGKNLNVDQVPIIIQRDMAK
jgi:thiol-disulfide isomerase/thioredoxin